MAASEGPEKLRDLVDARAFRPDLSFCMGSIEATIFMDLSAESASGAVDKVKFLAKLDKHASKLGGGTSKSKATAARKKNAAMGGMVDDLAMLSLGGAGAALAMGNAIRDAGIDPSEVAYVNAHATSTKVGDLIEIHAVKKVFGDHAPKLAMSSTKSMIGHLLGAAGAVEAIFTLLAMRDSVAPPTINLDNPDEGCDLDLVANQAQQRTIDVALSNSFGFGGTNGSLLFRKV